MILCCCCYLVHKMPTFTAYARTHTSSIIYRIELGLRRSTQNCARVICAAIATTARGHGHISASKREIEREGEKEPSSAIGANGPRAVFIISLCLFVSRSVYSINRFFLLLLFLLLHEKFLFGVRRRAQQPRQHACTMRMSATIVFSISIVCCCCNFLPIERERCVAAYFPPSMRILMMTIPHAVIGCHSLIISIVFFLLLLLVLSHISNSFSL